MADKRMFTESKNCTERRVCHVCRTNKGFREKVMETFEWDGECPHGFTVDDHPEPPEPPEMPSGRQQVANFFDAVERTAMRLMRGKRVIASGDVRKKRSEICDSCDLRSKNRCTQCGCQLLAKVALDGEKCPIGKW